LTLPLLSYYFLYLHCLVVFFAKRLLCLPLFVWHFLDRNSEDPSSLMWENNKLQIRASGYYWLPCVARMYWANSWQMENLTAECLELSAS